MHARGGWPVLECGRARKRASACVRGIYVCFAPRPVTSAATLPSEAARHLRGNAGLEGAHGHASGGGHTTLRALHARDGRPVRTHTRARTHPHAHARHHHHHQTTHTHTVRLAPDAGSLVATGATIGEQAHRHLCVQICPHGLWALSYLTCQTTCCFSPSHQRCRSEVPFGAELGLNSGF